MGVTLRLMGLLNQEGYKNGTPPIQLAQTQNFTYQTTPIPTLSID